MPRCKVRRNGLLDDGISEVGVGDVSILAARFEGIAQRHEFVQFRGAPELASPNRLP